MIFFFHTKQSFHDLCGRKFVGRNRTKTFRAKIFRNLQNLPVPTPAQHLQIVRVIYKIIKYFPAIIHKKLVVRN